MRIQFDRTHGGMAKAGVLDFSASINPVGAPPSAVAAFEAVAKLLTEYPDPCSARLKNAMGEWLQINPDSILPGNGSTQLIYLLARALRAERPYVVIPTFSEIANALMVSGTCPQPIELSEAEDFHLSIRQIERALDAGADAVFIGRPNSPTGSFIGQDEAGAIASACERCGCWCVFDEAFIDFVGEEHSVSRILGRYHKVIVIRSMTKIFAIPALRLGYLLASAPVIERLAHDLEPWSVNRAAEQVGLACIKDAAAFCAHSRALIGAEREYLAARLRRIPRLRVFPSAANFLMFRVEDGGREAALAAHMLERGIAVRDLASLPGCGPGLYRIAVRMRADNDTLIEGLRSFVPHPVTNA